MVVSYVEVSRVFGTRGGDGIITFLGDSSVESLVLLDALRYRDRVGCEQKYDKKMMLIALWIVQLSSVLVGAKFTV